MAARSQQNDPLDGRNLPGTTSAARNASTSPRGQGRLTAIARHITQRESNLPSMVHLSLTLLFRRVSDVGMPSILSHCNYIFSCGEVSDLYTVGQDFGVWGISRSWELEGSSESWEGVGPCKQGRIRVREGLGMFADELKRTSLP